MGPAEAHLPSRGRAGPGPSGNRILDALPPDDLTRIRPALRLVRLAPDAALTRPGVHDRVLFPRSGLISWMAHDDGNAMAYEVATGGNESVLGAAAVLWGCSMPRVSAVCRVSVEAHTMSVDDFRAEVAHPGHLRDVVHRYLALSLVQVVQNSLCGRTHRTHERLARWLLMASDRLATDDIPVTHGTLSSVLGIHRPGATLAAAELARRGAVRTARRRVVVTDRVVLERSACSCDPVVRSAFEGFLASLTPP